YYVESQPPRNACRIAAAGPAAGVFASDPALARWGWIAACALSSDIAGPTRRRLAWDLLHDLSGTRACEVLVIRLKTAEGGIALAPCGHIALERGHLGPGEGLDGVRRHTQAVLEN